MDNESGDRSNQVRDGENNGSGEQIPIPASQKNTHKKYGNEDKDYLQPFTKYLRLTLVSM